MNIEILHERENNRTTQSILDKAKSDFFNGLFHDATNDDWQDKLTKSFNDKFIVDEELPVSTFNTNGM